MENDVEINNGPDLTEEEKSAYEEWKKKQGAPLPLAKALGLYELFLNFYTIDEIYRINGQKIPLGQIVDARIRYEWDKRRGSQLDSLYGSIEKKVVKTKNEAVSHLTDLLAAAHKLWGDKIKKFIQDGDPSVLGDLNLSSFKNYKELITLFKDLTTENKPQAKAMLVGGQVQHVHSLKDGPYETRKMTSSSASEILKLFDDKKLGENA